MATPSLATGGLSWLSERERSQRIANRGDFARANAALDAAALQAAAHEEGAARAAGEIRKTGTLTKYRPVGGWRTPGPGFTAESSGNKAGSLREAAESVQLGAPTSYNAGAGAPAPITVMRGTQQTFAPQRQPGQQFIEGEFSSPLRAGQAFNRAAGVGQYVSPAELRGKDIIAQYNVEQDQQKQAQAILEQRLTDLYGEPELDAKGKPTGVKVLPSHVRGVYLEHLPSLKSPEQVNDLITKMGPQIQFRREAGFYSQPEARAKIASNYFLEKGITPNPDLIREFKETPILTPEDLTEAKRLYNWKPAPTKPNALPRGEIAGDGGLVAKGVDYATLLGRTLGYELQPLASRREPAPTLESVRAQRLAERQRIWSEEGEAARRLAGLP